jgi:hypothetical protein
MPDKLKTQRKALFFARKIRVEACNGTFTMGVTNMSRTQIVAVRPRTVVEFEVGITGEEAIAVLQALVAVIEADGLPDVCWTMDQMQSVLKVFTDPSTPGGTAAYEMKSSEKKECYEAATMHPDWFVAGNLVFCLNYSSPQNKLSKLLDWYRARRASTPGPETQ